MGTARTTPEYRTWNAHRLRSYQKRLRGLVPALPPEPVWERTRAQVVSAPVNPPAPAPPPIPVVVIPRRVLPLEPLEPRPAMRWNV
jgi:hypothetical protein